MPQTDNNRSSSDHVKSVPIWKRAFVRTLQLRWKFLFIYAVTTFIGIAIISPLFAGLKNLGFWIVGDAALTNNDIAYTLLSPLSVIIGILLFAISLVLSTFTLIMMMLTDAADRQSQRLNLPRLAQFFVREIRTLVDYQLRLLTRILAIFLPFLLIAVLYYATQLQEFDINYYLSYKPPEFKRAIGLAIVLLIIAGVMLGRKLISWSLALPLIIYGHVSASTAFATSSRLTASHLKTLLKVFILTFVITIVISLADLIWFEWLTARIILDLEQNLNTQVSWLVINLLIYLLINFLVGVWTTGMWATSLNELLKRVQKQHPEHTSASFSIIKEISQYPKPSRLIRLATSKLLLSLGVLFLLASSLMGFAIGFTSTDNVEIISHRGGAYDRPENTMAAFSHAMDNHTDWVELDVQEDADGTVVILHDKDFKRVGNADLPVYLATKAQLDQLDIGSHFDPEYAEQRTPTLQQVLEAAKGRTNVLIELKYYGKDVDLERKVAEIVEATGMVDNIAIMSLEYDGVQKMKAIRPNWSVGLLATVSVGNIFKLDVDFIAATRGMINHTFMLAAKANRIPIWAWTLNDPDAIDHYINLGIDGVITDNPVVVQQVLKQRQSYGFLERVVLYIKTLTS